MGKRAAGKISEYVYRCCGPAGGAGKSSVQCEEVFVKHQDRILFGTDCTPLGMGYHKIYYRFFETKDEYFPYQPEGELPGQGRWAIYGIGLEDEILKRYIIKMHVKFFLLMKTAL